MNPVSLILCGIAAVCAVLAAIYWFRAVGKIETGRHDGTVLPVNILSTAFFLTGATLMLGGLGYLVEALVFSSLA